MRIGVNLLVRNMADNPLHLAATRFAVRSLLESDLLSHDWRLMILDNGSGCPATSIYYDWMSVELGSRLGIARFKENLGIARGRNYCNKILQAGGGWIPDYIVEMHTDHVFPKIWLAPIIEYMETLPDCGIMGPALLSPNVHWCVNQIKIDYNQPYKEQINFLQSCVAFASHDVFRIMPGLTHPAVKRWKMVEELGGYDEDLPGLTNYEDTDEAYRAHKAGWKILINFGSVVYHHYHFSRCDPGVTNHLSDYEVNGRYCYAKHGVEFRDFERELGEWMDAAYGKVEA